MVIMLEHVWALLQVKFHALSYCIASRTICPENVLQSLVQAAGQLDRPEVRDATLA